MSAGNIDAGNTELGEAFRITKLRQPHALLIRCAGPATPINTGIGPAVAVHSTQLAVRCATGPERGAASLVTKPIATLVILGAAALRHVLGPGSNRAIIHDRFIERRELDSPTFLNLFGE
jgi:hypothetical protein